MSKEYQFVMSNLKSGTGRAKKLSNMVTRNYLIDATVTPSEESLKNTRERCLKEIMDYTGWKGDFEEKCVKIFVNDFEKTFAKKLS